MTTSTGTHTEQTVEVAGGRVRVLQDGSGPAVMVLHHSTGNPGWLPFHEALARRFHVSVPDMPGYGQSDRPVWARDPRDLAILIGRLIDRLGLHDVTLVGLGFGGFVAAELATMEPASLKALVLVGAAGLQPEQGEILDGMLVDFKDYVETGFRDAAAFEAAFGEDAAHTYRELWDYSREMTARLTWKPYMFNRRLAPLLAEVQTPALIVWGSEDRIVPPVCGQQYARALPHARLEVIQGAGHYVEMEEPERVAELVAQHAGAVKA